MHFSYAIFTMLLTASTAFAAPAADPEPVPEKKHSKPGFCIKPDTQSCHATDLIGASYNVDIGEQYSKAKCDAVTSELSDDEYIWGAVCWPVVGTSGDGSDCGMYDTQFWKHQMTQIQFSADQNHGDKINKILDKHFPGVNGFNCPDY